MELLHFLLLVFIGRIVSFDKAEGLRTEKIIDGTLVRAGRFKYVVAVMYKLEDMIYKNPCAGGIIDDWHISTAAHCFYDKQSGTYRNHPFYIVVSTNDLVNLLPSARYIQVNYVIMPNYYQPTELDTYYTKGDIAIVKLTERLNLYSNHPHLKDLEIPPQAATTFRPVFYIASYGWHEIGIFPIEVNGNVEHELTGRTDGKLRSARAKILSSTECQDLIHDRIAEGNMCARIIPKHPSRSFGICEGDSGSPLSHPPYLYGIAINGFGGCNEDEMPGFYINVSYYKTFIENALQNVITEDMRIIQLQLNSSGAYMFQEI